MRFLPSPEPERSPPPSAGGFGPSALLVSAVVVALATRWPWVQVQFERLFGTHHGPPGWHTTAGFTCLCTAMLVAVMALAETRTPSSRQAVRPGSLMLVAIAAAVLAFEFSSGPGMLRGVSANWTLPFYVTCVAVPLLLAICLQRFCALKTSPAHRGDAHDELGPREPGFSDQSSSGPPM